MVPNPSSLVGIGTVGSMLAGGNISKVQLPDGIAYAIKDSATSSLTQSEIDLGTDTSNKFISAKVLNEAIAAGNNTSATVSNETLHITTGLQVGDGVRY